MKKFKSKKKAFLYISISIILIIIVILLVVVLRKPKYTITFKIDNNLYEEYNKVSSGNTIDLPESPKREGYTFDGWYVDGKKFDSNTKVKDNMVLKAKFVINTYTVTFNLDNDSDKINEKVKYNEIVNKPEDPKKDGYIFAGWYVDDEKYDFDTKVSKDITIVAKWTKNTIAKYTVEHYLMDLDGKYGKVDSVETFDGKIGSIVTPNVKTYIGFTSPKKQSVEVEANGTAIVKYYYERNKYSVTINGDEGIKETIGTGTYYYGSQVKISAVLNKGYKLNKWSNGQNKINFTYTVKNSNVKINASTNLIKYNITYIGYFDDKEDKFITDNPKTYTIKDKVILKEPNLNGYTFKYYTLNDKTWDDYMIAAGTTGDMVVKAYFDVNSYKVSFKTELGKFDSEEERDLTVKFKALIPNVLNDTKYLPTREGYTFKGWSLNEEDSEQVAYDFKTPMVAEDIALYPIWEPIEYTITYDVKDGERCTYCSNDKYMHYNITSDLTLPTPAKDGYRFVGWQTTTGEVIKNIGKGNIGDLTLTAKWRKIIEVSYVDEILNKDTEFTNSVDDDNYSVLVGFKDKNTKFNSDKLEPLKTNIIALLDDVNVVKLEVGSSEVNSETLENVLKEILAKDDITDATYGDLLEKEIIVKVYLDENAVSPDNKDVLTYTISFRELEKITSQALQPLIKQNEYYINSHKDKHYEVVVENTNDLIFKYVLPDEYVFDTMMGAGLKTAMQTFLGDSKIGYIVITLEGMGPVKVTYDDIKDSNFWGFGFTLLDSFEKVVGKDAFDMLNKDLLNLKATLDVYASDGMYFDDGITTHYNISFAENKLN